MSSCNRYLLLIALSVLWCQWPISLASASQQRGVKISDDLLLAPDIPEIKPRDHETSEYLIGSVSVGIIFLESNGTKDPSTEDWVPAEESKVISEIGSALNWLASQNPSAGVSFTYDIHYRVPTSYEPISRPSEDERLWIGEAMTFLGYQGTYFDQIRDYLNQMRNKLGMPWAFAIFIVDSSNDADGRFADGKFAYAYFGGPFLVMTYDCGSLGIFKMDRVCAHETCHLFYATDEYNGEKEYSGYLNVADVERSGCLMDTLNSWVLSSGTRGQLGWRDTDGDSIQDIVDTFPKTTLTSVPPDITDATTLTFRGSVQEVPYPNENPFNYGRHVTINAIKTVRFKVDGSAWLDAISVDGSFDDAYEEFTFMISNLTVGPHTVEVHSVNSVNNAETSILKHTFTVTYVVIDQSTVSGMRVDASSVQKVYFHAIWAHDLSPLRGGVIFINGTACTVGDDGWVKMFVSSLQVGKQVWSVTGVGVNDVTRYRQVVPSPTIIWDQLEIVSVSANNTRMNVGGAFEVRYKIRYDSDDVVFDSRKGSVLGFTWDSVNLWWKKTVGGSTVVASTNYDETYITITDATYGLTAKQDVKGVDVTTDKVSITISIPNNRVEVGSSAPLNWTGVYEYDGTSFAGSVNYNNTLTKSVIGRYVYKVAHIADPLYGIAAFDTNEVYCIFDRITAKTKMESTIPGIIRVFVTLRFEYDDAPVNDASVKVHNVEVEEVADGVYEAALSIWSPIVENLVYIERVGFKPIEIRTVDYAIGNIALWAIIAILTVALLREIKKKLMQ